MVGSRGALGRAGDDFLGAIGAAKKVAGAPPEKITQVKALQGKFQRLGSLAAFLSLSRIDSGLEDPIPN